MPYNFRVISHQTPQHIASAIRAARGALSWSQVELAAHSGVSTPTIARIEACLISPKMETVSKIFRALEEGGVYFAWTAPGVYTMNASLVKRKTPR